MAKQYQEPKFPKGTISSVLSHMNDGVNPPNKRVNANGTKKKTGTTSQKRSK